MNFEIDSYCEDRFCDRPNEQMFLSQKAYVERLVEKFG